jgi:hypothetical protein
VMAKTLNPLFHRFILRFLPLPVRFRLCTARTRRGQYVLQTSSSSPTATPNVVLYRIDNVLGSVSCVRRTVFRFRPIPFRVWVEDQGAQVT